MTLHHLARTTATVALLLAALAPIRPAGAAETVATGTPAFAQCTGSFERGLCLWDGQKYVAVGGMNRAQGLWETYVSTEYVGRQNGMRCDGVTDDTAALNAILARIQAAGSRGVIRLSGTCLIRGAITPANDGTSRPRQAPVRIAGDGGDFDSGLYLGRQRGGTVLDLRYDGSDGAHPAKFDTRGSGVLQIDNLTIKGGEGLDDFPILQTTNTTLDFFAVTFSGNKNCFRDGYKTVDHNTRVPGDAPACKQDAIVLGGTTDDPALLAGLEPTSGFQGYATSLRELKFSRIRRAITFNSSANGIFVSNPTIDYTNGSEEEFSAPFVFTGRGNGTAGNVFSAGIVEMPGYKYGFAFIGAKQNAQNAIFGTGFYDANSKSIAGVYYGVGSDLNTFVPGATPPRPGFQSGVAGPWADRNLYIPTHPSDLMIVPNGLDAGRNDVSRLRRGVIIDGPQGVSTPTLFGGAAPGSGLLINSTSSGAPAGDFIAGNVGGKRNFTVTADRWEWASSVALTLPAKVNAYLPAAAPNGVAAGALCGDTAGQLYLSTAGGACKPTGAFASYTPVATAGSGTLGSYSASGSYQITGKAVVGTLNVAIGNVGSGTGPLLVTLPTAVRTYTGGAGIDLSSSRNLNVKIPGGGNTQAYIALDGGATIIANGSNLIIPFSYEMP